MNRHSITILCMFCGRPPQCPLVLSRGWCSRASDTRGGRALPGQHLDLQLVERQLVERQIVERQFVERQLETREALDAG